MRASCALVLILIAGACACGVPRATHAPSSPPVATVRLAEPTPPPARADALTILLGGDVELARATGRRLLQDPSYDPFSTLRPMLSRADVRFVNLEGPLSDQHGETMSPRNSLIFTGPPSGADALARAPITVVSTANNHAWDYGRSALLETIAELDRVGVAHAGTGATLDAAFAPTVVVSRGWRVGLVAVTDVFNFGPLERSAARAYIAGADSKAVADAIAAARAQKADIVIVSVHGGDEYVDQPPARTRALLHAFVDAGADVVVGHHPHVVQGVEWHSGKPIFYSLGNALMQMHRDHEWTGFGLFARVTFSRDGTSPASPERGRNLGSPARVQACPHRILGLKAIPLAQDPDAGPLERHFFGHLRTLQRLIGPTAALVEDPDADGCGELVPAGKP
jgi:poly-gamma-glutamate synthesis protein (capsule biosynthesis protein)